VKFLAPSTKLQVSRLAPANWRTKSSNGGSGVPVNRTMQMLGMPMYSRALPGCMSSGPPMP
jgi:hypothetical protein